jgi:peptidoglycan/xylan/chitin deacetylase (PgdA/CDA1 family)
VLLANTACSTARTPLTGQPFYARPASIAELIVVVYHYVREPLSSRFPRIQGLTTTGFCEQVKELCRRYEMATIESAMAFLDGRYRPRRSLCLLTFDDGLKEHARDVLEVLSVANVQGVFFVTTTCMAGAVATVHKNHHLMAALGFDDYRRAFMRRLAEVPVRMTDADPLQAELAYPWDPPAVASFKFLLNYRLPAEWRTQLVGELFETEIGDEFEFARELYLDPDDAVAMQDHGMIIGGHSHDHVPLSDLSAGAQMRDVAGCAARLRGVLRDQPHWPFSYPYGMSNAATRDALAHSGFDSGFALEGGANPPGQDRYAIRRVDTKDICF